jgi:hypothetical protein
MVLNQLFIEKPSLEILNKYVKAFGLNNIDDSTEFTILDMNKNNTLIQLQSIQTDLGDLYIPCKRKLYVEELTNKNAITVLRQLLKIYDRDLYSKEKFIKGTKYLVYKIISKQEKDFNKRNKKITKKKEIVIVFD